MTYTNAVLTTIAAALVYLCLVLTPWPRVQAQAPSTPDPSAGRVYIAGWIDHKGTVHHLPVLPNPGGLPVIVTP